MDDDCQFLSRMLPSHLTKSVCIHFQYLLPCFSVFSSPIIPPWRRFILLSPHLSLRPSTILGHPCWKRLTTDLYRQGRGTVYQRRLYHIIRPNRLETLVEILGLAWFPIRGSDVTPVSKTFGVIVWSGPFSTTFTSPK